MAAGLRAAMVAPLVAGILAADGEERDERPRHRRGSSLRLPSWIFLGATPAATWMEF
jgi:hypothetical protein